MTAVTVNTYTHSVTYVADNILKSFKDIVRLSGLSPEALSGGWESNMRALKTWLATKDLERVTLEIYNPSNNELITRWDIDVVYNWSGGDGSFWTDTAQLKYAIKKAGVAPQEAKYELKMHNKPGRPDVEGWGPCDMRSTDGMVRQAIGGTIEHSGLGGNAAYWRKA